jgi:hypothetical protein
MLSHDYRKYLINGGNIKLNHLKEDKIFLKFYNEIVFGKISVIHSVKQLTSLNGNKDSKIYSRNNGIKPLTSYEANNIKPLNVISHPIDRIINKYY